MSALMNVGHRSRGYHNLGHSFLKTLPKRKWRHSACVGRGRAGESVCAGGVRAKGVAGHGKKWAVVM